MELSQANSFSCAAPYSASMLISTMPESPPTTTPLRNRMSFLPSPNSEFPHRLTESYLLCRRYIPHPLKPAYIQVHVRVSNILRGDIHTQREGGKEIHFAGNGTEAIRQVLNMPATSFTASATTLCLRTFYVFYLRPWIQVNCFFSIYFVCLHSHIFICLF